MKKKEHQERDEETIFLVWALIPPEWVILGTSSVTPASDSSFEMKGWAKKSLRVTPDSLKNAVSCERPFLNYHTPDHCVGSSD